MASDRPTRHNYSTLCGSRGFAMLCVRAVCLQAHAQRAAARTPKLYTCAGATFADQLVLRRVCRARVANMSKSAPHWNTQGTSRRVSAAAAYQSDHRRTIRIRGEHVSNCPRRGVQREHLVHVFPTIGRDATRLVHSSHDMLCCVGVGSRPNVL